ncbi:Cysteine protease atg4 [Microbotryomycetes sp. JL201]|nr:Cysteine protease atg4 [Microbotryomycetes sp. JL201]
MLANAMSTVHLDRNWRRPLPQTTDLSVPDAAKYSRIVSMFIDDPSAPFSVHRFAATGESLGKAVGQWFGPSTASGAIRTLANSHPACGLHVVNAIDGTIFKSDVSSAAGCDNGAWTTPVLVLIGLRLGIDGVNPIYHSAVKGIFQFPQSVGIAGGRPSSSYYFVGSQADSLYYIDPHHARPAIPRRPVPDDLQAIDETVPISTRQEQANRDGDHLAQGDDDRGLHELEGFYAKAYPDGELQTYHCDRVRKMPLSALDPSMLVGFLIKDEQDWDDFSYRVQHLSADAKPIFSIAASPPAWMRRPSASPAPVRPRSGTMVSQSPTGTLHGETSPAVMVTDAEGEFYSEPEDWELDSTDASGDDLDEDGELRQSTSRQQEP